MDDNSRFRRLAKLGVYGHQPGIAAHVKTTLGEEQEIVLGILGQKVGSNPKSMQACKDFFRASSEEDSGTIKVKIARLTTKVHYQMEPHKDEGGRRGPPTGSQLCHPTPAASLRVVCATRRKKRGGCSSEPPKGSEPSTASIASTKSTPPERTANVA